jgi:TolB protein
MLDSGDRPLGARLCGLVKEGKMNRLTSAFLCLALAIAELAHGLPGDRIAFEGHSDYLILSIDAGGANLTQLGVGRYPAWSPDGERIAFLRDTIDSLDVYSDIWIMAADGADPVPLELPLLGFGLIGGIAWSPDGTRIAFGSHPSSLPQNHGIWVVDADGTDPVKLVSGSGPAWSPDGSQIAYSRQRAGGDSAEIWVMDADGTNPTWLISDGFGPAWSPDGTEIAFTRMVVDAEHDKGLSAVALAVMNADGSSSVELSAGSSFGVHPSWSPDGSRIAFHQLFEFGTDPRIWIIDADGNNKALLTKGRNPSWSPIPSGMSTVIESMSWGQIKAGAD